MAESQKVTNLKVGVTEGEARELDQALNDVRYLYENAGQVFACLQNMIEAGELQDHIVAVAYLSSVAMEGKAESDGKLLEEFSVDLTKARLSEENADAT